MRRTPPTRVRGRRPDRVGPADQVSGDRRELLEIGVKSIRFMHEMRNAETGEVAAVCEITAVHLDRQAHKSTAFADAILKSAERQLAVPEPAGA